MDCPSSKRVLANYRPQTVRSEVSIPSSVASDYSGRTIYVHHLCDHYLAAAAALRQIGFSVSILPEPDDDAVSCARDFCSGKECLPGLLMAGDIIKFLRAHKPDTDKIAFFDILGTAPPCRSGQYGAFNRLILDELGLKNVPLFPFFFGGIGKIYKRPLPLTLRADTADAFYMGFHAVDILMRALHQTRPYERVEGQADSAYAASLALVLDGIENGSDGVDVMRDCLELFEKVAVEEQKPKPIIGLTGETIVRFNRFANNDLVGRLEALGAEVWMAPLAEWQFSRHLFQPGRLVRQRRYWLAAKRVWKEWLLQRRQHRLARVFGGFLRQFEDLDMRESMKRFRPYIEATTLGVGTPWLVADVVEFLENGVDGVVCVIPFTCMPGNMLDAILRRIRKDWPDTPCLMLPFEALEGTNITTRIEAFVYQARENIGRKEHTK
jgi:predicted nucleotide-binding protein (sugar kinase/HSP70/actin superfamily)